MKWHTSPKLYSVRHHLIAHILGNVVYIISADELSSYPYGLQDRYGNRIKGDVAGVLWCFENDKICPKNGIFEWRVHHGEREFSVREFLEKSDLA